MKRFADCHIHIDNHIAPTFEGPVKMFDLMADLGVTDGALLALGSSHISQNLDVLYHKHTYKKIALRAFGAIDDVYSVYKHIPAERKLEKLYELGIDGVKFINMKPNVRKKAGIGINSEFFDKALSMMEERGTPVLIHSGDPDHFWDISKMSEEHISRGWFYGDGTHPSLEQTYSECYEMLDKHPKLNVTFAHFFFLSNRIDESRRVMEKYPNVMFDLTPNTFMYEDFSKNIDAWQKFFIEYQDRILFGTDSANRKSYNDALNREVLRALTHDKSEFEMGIYHKPTVRGLELPDSVVDKICYDNFARFAGERMVPVNTSLLLDEAEKKLSDIKNEEEHELSVKWLSELSSKL